mmetsp:Transcript_13384/g.44701  ORF Transcript_13384/g.44701 Transcript_13384/m.44701 type:complete len:219 (-) Transcript_13384:2028-2684(-)
MYGCRRKEAGGRPDLRRWGRRRSRKHRILQPRGATRHRSDCSGRRRRGARRLNGAQSRGGGLARHGRRAPLLGDGLRARRGLLDAEELEKADADVHTHRLELVGREVVRRRQLRRRKAHATLARTPASAVPVLRRPWRALGVSVADAAVFASALAITLAAAVVALAAASTSTLAAATAATAPVLRQRAPLRRLRLHRRAASPMLGEGRADAGTGERGL